MTLSRWSAYGWLMSFIVLSGCMFVVGVVIGRNTAPVFDMEQIDAKMDRLKNSSLEQLEKGIEAAQKQKEHYLEVAKNIDIFEPLKEKGKSLLAYKPYIPPLKAPKYDKNEKPKEESAPEPESIDQAQASMGPQEIQLAQAQTEDQPGQEMEAPAAHPSDGANEPATQEKPLMVKEAVSKPKYIKEAAQPSTAPLSASLESKTENAEDASFSVQPEAHPDAGIQESGHPAAQVDQKDQPSVVADQTPSDTTAQAAPLGEAECKPPQGSRQFTIQVASLREVDKANIVRDKFRQKGYPAYCQASPVRGEVWHRVRIGPYPDRAIAEKDCRRLEEAGFDALMLVVNP
jgi:cell division protein FtsN